MRSGPINNLSKFNVQSHQFRDQTASFIEDRIDVWRNLTRIEAQQKELATKLALLTLETSNKSPRGASSEDSRAVKSSDFY